MAEKFTVEDRIKHFLRVAEDAGATQAERDTASEQAERLMAKHLIDRISLDLHSDEKKTVEPIVRERIWFAGGSGSIAYDLQQGLGAVARAMQTYAVYYDYRKGGYYGRTTVYGGHQRPAKGIELEIIGFKSDVEATVQLINSLQVQAPLALRAYQKAEKAKTYGAFWGLDKAGAWRVSLGFVQAFGQGAAARVRETRKSVLNEYDDATALVLVDRSKAVTEFVEENMDLKTKVDRRMISGAARAAGFAAGHSAAGTNQQNELRQNSRALGN